MTVAPDDQWRIDNARGLTGLRLHFRSFKRRSDEWNHEHCVACWATFAEFDGPNTLHEGYTTGPDYAHGARYDWVCAACFADLKHALNWTASEDRPIG